MSSYRSGSITSDWFGSPIEAPFDWRLELDDQSLFYSVQYAGKVSLTQGELAGSFIEGLFNRDVAEIFIGYKDSLAYIELNLAPSGAWWAMEHSEYRVRSANPLSQVTTASSFELGEWRASMRIKTTELVGVPDTFHVTAIIGGQFLSSKPLSDCEPDFHSSGCFETIVVAEASKKR